MKVADWWENGSGQLEMKRMEMNQSETIWLFLNQLKQTTFSGNIYMKYSIDSKREPEIG